MNIPKIHPLGVNIIIGTLFARLATTMSMPFLAILLTTQKGISPSVTGLIIGISALVSIFTGIIGGNLSDKYGRKSVMMGSICLWILVFLGFSIADSSISFFILSALNGACGSFLSLLHARYFLKQQTQRINY
ncbi:MFS transporter [Bacillus cereus]